MQHPDEGMIHTWLDGELSAEDAGALETHVAECAACAAAVAEARGLIAGSSRIVSSLDSVPAGVIPEVRRAHRAWYSTTQFRAAAALLIVAGTSFLVVNKSGNTDGKSMTAAAPRVVATDAMSTAAAAAASKPADALSAKGAEPKPNASLRGLAGSSNAPVAGANAALQKQRGESLADRPSAPALAAGRAIQPNSPETNAVQDSAEVREPITAEVAAGNTLKLIRTDSLRESTNRVFEMANGIQLILTESNRLAFSPNAAQSTSRRELSASSKVAARAAPVIPAPLAKDAVKLSDYRTITWMDDATGRSYSLTGPLPPDQLEKFKALVVKLSH